MEFLLGGICLVLLVLLAWNDKRHEAKELELIRLLQTPVELVSMEQHKREPVDPIPFEDDTALRAYKENRRVNGAG